jgi:hypothetical protein
VVLNTIDHNGSFNLKQKSRISLLMTLHREGDSLRVIDEKAIQEAKRWKNMSFTEKIGDFTERRQYSLIIGGWATSLGVAAAIISRNKYQTFPQKVHFKIFIIDN